MSNYMDINGKKFRVVHPRKYPVSLSNSYFMRGLYDCYDRPSEAKQYIYDKWYEWYRNDPRLTEFGVTSYNTFGFTLGCVFQDDETGERGYIRITPTYNTIYMA